MRRGPTLLALLLGAAAPAAAGPPPPGDEAAADDPGVRTYAELERDFALRPRAETLAALDRLAREQPRSPAAPRALLWRGQLALVDGQPEVARARLSALLSRYPAAPGAPLAEVALGELALSAGRLDEAGQRFEAAALTASPALRAELASRQAALRTAVERRRLGLGALAVLSLCLALLALAARAPGPGAAPLRLPLETVFALPLASLLVLSGWLADRRATAALALGAAGSLALTTLSGLAAQRRAAAGRRPRSLAHGAPLALGALLLGLTALAYLAAWQGQLLDLLRDTVLPALP